ncbi:MAG: ABC transporter ATP-binding protein [Thermomicrobiales bacterium]
MSHDSATPYALRLRGLRKQFGGVVAVDGVDLDVAPGEFLTLLGPSGSGKTTILKMIAGFEAPTGGAIELAGRDVSALSPAERGIGVVFQQYALFPHMTVGENIAYPLKLRKTPAAERAARVDEMLALVELAGYGARLPRELSGGQQQRVAVARALAFKPALLLMDEPLGALDRALRVGMQEEIRRIHRDSGATILYVTHDQEEALTMSDRVAIMREGRLRQVGPPRQLYERPADQFVATFFGECTLIPAELLDPADEASAAPATHAGATPPASEAVRTEPAAVIPAGEADVRVRVLDHEATVRRGGPLPSREIALAVRPGRIRLHPAPGDLPLPATIVDLLYLGDAVRIIARHPDAGEILVRADPDATRDLRIGQQVTFGFAPKDAVAVGGER